MADTEGLTNEELRELVLEQLKNLGVDPDPIEIEIVDSVNIILRGKVDSESEREMIKQTMLDVLGVSAIIDDLVAICSENRDLLDTEEHEEGELYDEDEECIGTEDVFRSVEDGVPYIPPTSPTYQKSPETIKWKKKRKKE